jgi:hypothetical protein
MKKYYYNQKSQDLLIFDTDSKDLMVLERIVGIRVLTSSDLDNPTDEPVKHWANSVYNPKDGKAHPDYNGSSPRVKSESAYEKEVAKAKKRKCGKCGKPGHRSDNCEKFVSESPTSKKKGKGGKWKCKNCGELGHSAKTCKNPAKLPDAEIDNIVKEERAPDTPDPLL